MSSIAMATLAALSGGDLTEAEYTQVIDRVSPYELADAWRDATGDRIEPGPSSSDGFQISIRRGESSMGELRGSDCAGNGARIRCRKVAFSWTVTAAQRAGAQASAWYFGNSNFTSKSFDDTRVTIRRREDLHGGVTRGHAFHLIRLMTEDVVRLEGVVAQHGNEESFGLSGPPLPR